MLLSKYPFLRADEIIFPPENHNVPLENCIRSDIRINDQILRIYNCHLGIYKVGITTRLKQLEHILSDARGHYGPTIICGDMNVTVPKTGWNRRIITLWHQEPKQEMSVNGKFIDYDERELFNETINRYGFKEALDLYTPTWSPFKSKHWELFNLKLDWFIFKNLGTTDIRLGDYTSDHRAIFAECLIT